MPAPDNVVEQAIAYVGGSPAELAKQLSKEMGKQISRQSVNGWRKRGTLPRNVAIPVQNLCKIPLGVIAAEWAKKRPTRPMGVPMKQCCMLAFVAKGVVDNFRLAEEGDRFRCPSCGQLYELRGTWQPVDKEL